MISKKSFWISLMAVFSVCAGYYFHSLSQTEGNFTYPIDDAYIHLAIAKKFSENHIWGVTSHQFSSTSSAPLFTFILSFLITVFGNHDIIPLLFNIFFGAGIIYILNKYYSQYFAKSSHIVLATLFTVFFSLLHLHVLMGMEHIFQVFLFAVNIYCLSQKDKSKIASGVFFSTLFLMGLVRFESMFYFVILAFVFLILKNWRDALLVLIIGFLPIVLFCCFNFQQSGYYFPNSVVVKGTRLSLDSTLFNQIKNIFIHKLLLNISFYKIGIFPILICILIIRKSWKGNKFSDIIKNNFLLVVFSLLMICHTLFADLKGAFRYEAYILVGFSMAIIPKIINLFENFRSFIKEETLLSFLIVMNIFLMIYKLNSGHQLLRYGSKNIYEQQVQSARFLNQYYNHAKVVANDIGAITYFTDIRLLDIAGLASTETIVFNEKNAVFGSEFKSFLTDYCDDHQFEIAVVYEDWLQGQIPDNWRKVADLTIQNKTTVANSRVSIYSIDQTKIDLLKENIKRFKWNRNVSLEIIN
ncbi:hypothetical protein [Chryseobacterium wangxinyae]|uniref:hypothetical protein n=1 Tax=Chryseobacterium sp. CY353 TaxID=2997334 RepID=UPI00226E42BB|nr:hypothetical protein [Chryseobacterium sp. CY353]MCY0969491.1 hypothetical protein [Chryseobacterium sp. CY353]